eukprot:Skav203878  [mRNA]  locus=scaffold252:26243:34229:- [translate_table: standard]
MIYPAKPNHGDAPTNQVNLADRCQCSRNRSVRSSTTASKPWAKLQMDQQSSSTCAIQKARNGSEALHWIPE